MKTENGNGWVARNQVWQVWVAWMRGTVRLCLIGALAAGAVAASAGRLDAGGKKTFKVYQGNAFVGGYIEAPLLLDPADTNYVGELLGTVTMVYQQIVRANAPARMAGLAAEIAAEEPDIAGLEELYTVEMAPATGQGRPGEFTVLYDYLELLTESLAAKGAHYRVAVVSTESDIAMPMIGSLEPFTMAFGRIVDHEAILVRTDLPPGYLEASNPQTGRFTNYVQVPALGLEVYRGWCAVDVLARGERFRVVCAHPHDESAPEIQKAEIMELMAEQSNVPMPVMVIGDLNSDPLGRNGTDSYGAFVANGFRDTWAALHPNDVAGGLTWGHDMDLADPGTGFVYRLDYFLYHGDVFSPVSMTVLDPRISVSAPPLWASDHAAIAATFYLGNPKALNGSAGAK